MTRLLYLLLSERDRDTVFGDLIEERGARTAEIGLIWAELWFAIQVLSFVPGAFVSRCSKHLSLTSLCLFTALCGAWLGAMDLRLRHPGYVGQVGIAITIVLQALLTLWMLVIPTRVIRVLAMAGSCAIVWLAFKAFNGVMHDSHFEGYIVLIAIALTIQSVLTWIALRRQRPVRMISSRRSAPSQ